MLYKMVWMANRVPVVKGLARKATAWFNRSSTQVALPAAAPGQDLETVGGFSVAVNSRGVGMTASGWSAIVNSLCVAGTAAAALAVFFFRQRGDAPGRAANSFSLRIGTPTFWAGVQARGLPAIFIPLCLAAVALMAVAYIAVVYFPRRLRG